MQRSTRLRAVDEAHGRVVVVQIGQMELRSQSRGQFLVAADDRDAIVRLDEVGEQICGQIAARRVRQMLAEQRARQRTHHLAVAQAQPSIRVGGAESLVVAPVEQNEMLRIGRHHISERRAERPRRNDASRLLHIETGQPHAQKRRFDKRSSARLRGIADGHGMKPPPVDVRYAPNV